MLTLGEILSDVGMSPGFNNVGEISIHTRGDGGQSPLHWMATLGDASAICLMLDAGADIDAIDCNGNTPLHEAIASRQASAARSLIERGADMHIQNNRALTPMNLANQMASPPSSNYSIVRNSVDPLP